MIRDALEPLPREDLIALILAQAAQIEALTQRVAEPEARLGQPPKSPDNSSVPPSQGRKANRAERRAAKKRKGRPGGVPQARRGPGPRGGGAGGGLPILRPRADTGRSARLPGL
jgi:hypothetical protein